MDETPAALTETKRFRFKRLLSRVKILVPFLGGVLAALLGVLAYHLLFPPPPPLSLQDVNNTVAQAMASATPAPAFSERVYQAIQPSLVLIETKLTTPTDGKDVGLGSGVIIDDQGDILTALHVVAGGSGIQLTFADGTTSEAQIANQQPENDIAVLRAVHPPAQIVPATLGNPNAVQTGDEAYVVGNPLGLYSSMSAGVISGLHRTFQPPDGGQKIKNMIQIDAAVNPGNSGGPLLNRSGQVIGIVTGLVNPSGQDAFAGIGFAVPINIAGGALGSPVD
jgi:S1-C subfamily serine protease